MRRQPSRLTLLHVLTLLSLTLTLISPGVPAPRAFAAESAPPLTVAPILPAQQNSVENSFSHQRRVSLEATDPITVTASPLRATSAPAAQPSNRVYIPLVQVPGASAQAPPAKTTPSPTPPASATPSPTPPASATPSPTPPASATPSPTPVRNADQLVVSPAQGGTLASADGRLRLEVPAGAVAEPVTISYQTVAASAPDGHQRVGGAFSLTAITASGQSVRHFARPLTLRVGYAEQTGLDETRLQIFFTDAEHPAWAPLTSTVDPQKNQVVAQTDHFTTFAILAGPTLSDVCDPAVDPALDAAFQAANQAGETPGCPTGPASSWSGALTQYFENGAAIVAGYYVGPGYIEGYTNAGGPTGFLGLPIQSSFSATNPPAYYRDYFSNFTGTPIQAFQGGFVGMSYGSWEGARHYPLACDVRVAVTKEFIDGPIPPGETKPTQIEKKKVAITASGIADPGSGTGSFNSGAASIVGSDGQFSGGGMSANGESFIYISNKLFDPAADIFISVDLYRSGDSRVGYFPQTWIVDYTDAPVPAGYGNFTLHTCTGGSLPGGGGFGGPPPDTTPPTISDVKINQDGSRNLFVAAKVTDNRAVGDVSVKIDGAESAMAPHGGSQYGATVYDLAVGNHTLRIVAHDTSNNERLWPEDGDLIIKIEDSADYGQVPWVGYSKDPVSTLIGNFIYQYTDLKLAEPGPDLAITRFYNAQSSAVGRFGLGWSTLLDMQVTALDNPLLAGALVRYADGHTALFPAAGGGFGRAPFSFDTLAHDGDGFLLTTTDQTRYRFASDGRLAKVEDASGNALVLTYNGNALAKVAASSGHALTFTSDDKGRITGITAPENVSLSYTYDGDGRLMSVKDGNGGTMAYAYDKDHGLTKITTPAGDNFVQEQRYDDQGRVTYQRVGDNFVNEFAYDDAKHTTTVSDTYGHTTTYGYDDKGRLIAQTDALGKTDTFTYNDDNQVTSHTDRNGNTTTYEYLDGNKVKEIDALGGVRSWTYNTQRHVSSATDQLGHTTTYDYDAQGRQIAVVDALNQRMEMHYNAQGQMIERKGLRGEVTTYTYDAQGNLTAETDALGHTTRYTYDAQGRKLTQTDALGGVRSWTYDANGNVLTETDPLTHTTTYVYDKNNGRTAETDANGNTTSYEYSTLGYLVTTTHADGGVTTITYDDLGNKVAETDPLGHTRKWALDPLYRVAKAIDPTGAVTTYTYDANGNQRTITDPRGFTTTIEYDALNREVRRTDALGWVTQTAYDAAGNRTRVTAANGATTDYAYDALNRVVTVTDALGAVTKTTYDAAGDRVTETDALGNTTQHAYDLLGREVATTDALGNVTRTTYDALGHVVTVTDANGAVTRSEYDAAGRLTATIDALGEITRSEYDPAGNLTATVDALGLRTTMTYDVMNRVVAVTDALGGITHTAYDLAGHRTTVTDANGNTSTYTYDAAGRTVLVTDPLGFMVASAYDLSGNLVKSTDQAGAVTTSEYDALNRNMRQVNALGFATAFAYDAVGNLLTTTDANGGIRASTYDLLNRVITETDALGHVTQHHYDALGRRISTTDANGVVTTTTYDALGRVISQTDGEGITRSSTYDAVGNQISATDANGNTTANSYDLLHRLVEQRDSLGLIQRRAYDAVGNVVADTDGNGHTTTISYDALGRQVRITDAEGNTSTVAYDAVSNLVAETDGNGHTTTHAYDARNQRVATTDARGNTTTFSFDPVGRPLMTTDALGVMTLNRYDAVGQMIAVTLNYNASALPNAQTNVTTRYSFDPVGNRIAITDPKGAVTSFSPDALGQLVAETDPLGNTTTYIFDAVGSQIERHEPNGNLVKTAYDRNRRPVLITYADGSTVTKRYDGNGNLIELRDSSGVTSFTYDARNRKTSETSALGTVATAYDGANNELSVTYPNGRVIKKRYLRNNWLKEVISPAAHEDSDSSGGDHTSSGDGYASKAEPIGERTSYERDGIGQVLRQINGNGTITTQTYDEANNLLSIETRQVDLSHQGDDAKHDDSGHLITAVTYRYDAVNQRTEATTSQHDDEEHRLTEHYRYDQLRRLIEMRDSSGQVMTYTFDAASNRLVWRTKNATHEDEPGPAVDFIYSYDAADEMLQVERRVIIDDRDEDDGHVGSKPDNSGDDDRDDGSHEDASRLTLVRYRYDANGNRVERSDNHSGTSYSYNGENRLVAAQDFAVRDDGQHKPATLTTMAYDGIGRRITRTISAGQSEDDSSHSASAQSSSSHDDSADEHQAQTRRYSYNGLDPIAFVDGWKPQATNLYRADGGRILLQDGAGKDEGGQLWLTQDGLGSTIAASDASGDDTASYHYDPYGKASPREDETQLSYLFTGQEYDASTGLYHFFARDYDPETGTWLTRDPYRGTPNDPQSLHRYGYVKGNPVNLVDALGYFSFDLIQAIKDLLKSRDKTNEGTYTCPQRKQDSSQGSQEQSECKISKEKVQQMIQDARTFGANLAADNLQYWLDGTGEDKNLSTDYFKNEGFILDHLRGTARDRFILGSRKRLGNELRIGSTFSLYWEDSVQANPIFDANLFFGLGGFTIRSDVTVRANEDSGKTRVSFDKWETFISDTYNWDDGKSTLVPIWGTIKDSDMKCLENKGVAKSYRIKSDQWQVTDSQATKTFTIP